MAVCQDDRIRGAAQWHYDAAMVAVHPVQGGKSRTEKEKKEGAVKHPLYLTVADRVLAARR